MWTKLTSLSFLQEETLIIKCIQNKNNITLTNFIYLFCIKKESKVLGSGNMIICQDKPKKNIAKSIVF